MERFRRQSIDPASLPQHVVEKWSYSVLNEGFVPFPKKLVRCLCRLFSDTDSLKELAVLLAIVDFKRPNLTRLPSQAYLSFLAGLTEDEFTETLGHLQRKGYVHIEGDPDNLNISLNGLLQAIDREAK